MRIRKKRGKKRKVLCLQRSFSTFGVCTFSYIHFFSWLERNSQAIALFFLKYQPQALRIDGRYCRQNSRTKERNGASRTCHKKHCIFCSKVPWKSYMHVVSLCHKIMFWVTPLRWPLFGYNKKIDHCSTSITGKSRTFRMSKTKGKNGCCWHTFFFCSPPPHSRHQHGNASKQ